MKLEDRIISQLGRRHEMLMQINEWENPVRVIRWRNPAIGLAIAACLVLILVVRPLMHTEQISALDQLGIDQPTLSDFRAASPTSSEIDATMDSQDYATALIQIDEALRDSDRELKRLQDYLYLEDESILYESEVAIAHNYQLRWLRIYTLVRLERRDEAIKDLEFYVTLKSEHRKDAKNLLRMLKDN